jgi:hypothetical protein
MYSSTLPSTPAVVNPIPRLLYPRERLCTRCIGGWWATKLVWTGAENLPTGIRSPDRPPRSGSLYGLSYPGPFKIYVHWHYMNQMMYTIINLLETDFF